VRQGEIRTYLGRPRILIVSNNAVNMTAYPVAVPVGRQPLDVPGFLIPFTDQDPVSGHADVGRLGIIDPEHLGEPDALLSGATLHRVLAAIHALFDPE
jgi:mRNA-degrading endonuclease toxin of MazEF toxin-antitoxin module